MELVVAKVAIAEKINIDDLRYLLKNRARQQAKNCVT
jgi:hypothetical protein